MGMTSARAVGVLIAFLISAPAVADAQFYTSLDIVIGGNPLCFAEDSAPVPTSRDCDFSGRLPPEQGGGRYHTVARASEDASGLHAYAFVNASGTPPFYEPPVDATSRAYAEILEQFHFATVGTAIAHATITTTGSGAGAYTHLGWGGFGGGCNFGDAGSCTDSIVFDLSQGLLLDMFLVDLAQVWIPGFASGDFSSLISSLYFTDLAGNLVDLAYTTDSGFTYPMTRAAEPGSLALLSVGLAGLWLGARRRTRPRAGRSTAS